MCVCVRVCVCVCIYISKYIHICIYTYTIMGDHSTTYYFDTVMPYIPKHNRPMDKGIHATLP